MSVNARHLGIMLDRIITGRLIYVETGPEPVPATVICHENVRYLVRGVGLDWEEFQEVVRASILRYPDGTVDIMWGDVEDYYSRTGAGVRH